MERAESILKSPLVVATWIFMLLFALLKFGPNLPLSVYTQARGEPFVVSETGEAAAVPDEAQISFGITQSGSDVATIESSANKISKSLTDAVSTYGVEKKDIKTTSYNISPDYDYTSQNPAITGYRIDISYTVKIRDLSKINDVLTAVTAAGANQVGGVSLGFSDEARDKLLLTARAEAVEKAKAKAEGLASAAGISLGKVINISESSGGKYPRPLYDSVALSAPSVPEKTTANIEPGESNVSVTVSMSWEVR